MARANELRSKMTDKVKGRMNELTNRVDEKLEYKVQKAENDYIAEFAKNVDKRKKMEDKKKKLVQAKNLDAEAYQERKIEKWQGIQSR